MGLEQGPEQSVYARWLDIGARLGFAALAATFLVYVLGLVEPHVPREQLPALWTLSLAEYRARTGAPAGWGWLGWVGRGDYLALAAIALVCLTTLVCYARVAFFFFRRRERAQGWLAVAQIGVLLAAMFAFAGASHAAEQKEVPDWFTDTFLDVREDVAEARKGGKRVAYYFWLDGCPYCRRMVEDTFSDPRIKARLLRDFLPVAINVRGDREVTAADGKAMPEKDFTRAHAVRGTPTVLFFDESGAVVRRVVGHVPPGEFERILDQVRPSGDNRPNPSRR